MTGAHARCPVALVLSGKQRHPDSGICKPSTYPVVTMSRASAAWVREEMSEIVGIGSKEKSLVQEATRELSMMNPGSNVGT